MLGKANTNLKLASKRGGPKSKTLPFKTIGVSYRGGAYMKEGD